MTAERRKVDFPSAGSRCAAWHYPDDNDACVIMAAGLAVIKEPGTDPLARRFHDAGCPSGRVATLPPSTRISKPHWASHGGQVRRCLPAVHIARSTAARPLT
jgi:hypothetical protein